MLYLIWFLAGFLKSKINGSETEKLTYLDQGWMGWMCVRLDDGRHLFAHLKKDSLLFKYHQVRAKRLKSTAEKNVQLEDNNTNCIIHKNEDNLNRNNG